MTRRRLPLVATLVALFASSLVWQRSSGAIRDCTSFATQADAQSFFLKQGGPAADPNGLDPDNNGLACDGNSAPVRGLLTIDHAGGAFSGQITSVSADCVVGRAIKVFKIKAGRDKLIGSDDADKAGGFQIPTTLEKGKFYARTSTVGDCASERSVTLQLPLRRIEITPSGLFFTATDQTRQLSASAFAPDGQPLSVPASVFWSSSDPSVISVDRNGLARSMVANGSAQIVASVGGVRSAPVLAVVTPVAEGAVLLSDGNIATPPAETDPDASPSFANTLTVVVDGISAPSVGDLLINTGDVPLAGRVVSVEDLGDGRFRLVLANVSLDEAFPDLDVNETFDLGHAPITVNPEITDGYDVSRSGTVFTFRPKTASPPSGVRAAGAVGTRALPPIFEDCEVETTPSSDSLPIKLGAPPLFEIDVNPSVEFVSTITDGFQRFVIRARPQITFEGGVEVTAEFEGKIECKVELFTFTVPVGGPLSVFISGLVPVGLGMEVGGKLTVADVAVGSKAVVNGDLSLGIDCATAAGCGFVRSMNVNATAEPKLDAPSVGDIRFEPELSAFAYLEADVGNRFFRRLQLTAFEAKVGAKAEGTFATKTSQVADEEYKSNYGVSLFAGAALGDDVEGVAQWLGLDDVAGVELEFSTPLAESPSGTLKSDTGSFQTGDEVVFDAHLDDVTFFGTYNVHRVSLMRRSGGSLTEVGNVAARRGQTDFRFTFVAPGPGTTDEFFLFVTTKVLPFDLLSLEIAKTEPIGIFVVSRRTWARSRAAVALEDGQGQRTRIEDYRPYVEYTEPYGLWANPLDLHASGALTDPPNDQNGDTSGAGSVVGGHVDELSTDGKNITIEATTDSTITSTARNTRPSPWNAGAGGETANYLELRLRVSGPPVPFGCAATITASPNNTTYGHVVALWDTENPIFVFEDEGSHAEDVVLPSGNYFLRIGRDHTDGITGNAAGVSKVTTSSLDAMCTSGIA
jgi:hypothetical protein